MNLLRKVIWKISHLFFDFFEKKLRLHVLPVHFYSPVPDTSQLEEKVFEKSFICKGLNWNTDVQNAHLNSIFNKYKNEYSPIQNSGLSLVDAFVLHCMVREYKPI